MNIWTKISSIGANPGDTAYTLRKIHLINQMCFLASITTFVFVPPLIFAGNNYYAGIQMAAGILSGISIFFCSLRKYKLALYWMLISILVNIFYCSLEIPGSGVECFLIPLSIIPLIVIENNKTCIGLMLLCLSFFLISYFLKRTYVPHFRITEKATEVLFLMVLVSTFVLCLIVVMQFKTINKKFEQIISNQNMVLEHKNKEITDSIIYAKRIQDALITSQKYIDKTLLRMTNETTNN
jgi:hypothetical protein